MQFQEQPMLQTFHINQFIYYFHKQKDVQNLIRIKLLKKKMLFIYGNVRAANDNMFKSQNGQPNMQDNAEELISDVLLWTPTHGRAKAGRPARTYIQQLCEDSGCCPEDLPEAMNDKEKWRERVRDIRATSTT